MANLYSCTTFIHDNFHMALFFRGVVQVNQIAIEVINLVENDDEVVGIVDSVTNAFQQLIDSQELPQVVSSNVETIRKPFRSYAKRPRNWEDIANHYLTYRRVRSTMKLFELNNTNASVPNALETSLVAAFGGVFGRIKLKNPNKPDMPAAK